MNDTGSITDFFYNIIPGSIFLFFLNFFYHIDIVNIYKTNNKDSASVIFIYIVFGLFIGFLFQCFTKILRREIWNDRAFKKVKELSPTEFTDVYKYLIKNNQNENKVFYLMDNALRGDNPAFLATHFSSRHAFWANIFWSIFFLIILSFFIPMQLEFNPFIKLLMIILLFFSLKMADEHLVNFYDSILKSYYMKKFKKF